MSLASGTRLGSFAIVSKLGDGGMGEVYRGTDTRLGREVAIKVLAAATASSPDALVRFEREGRAIAALNHPNICTLYDVGTEDGRECHRRFGERFNRAWLPAAVHEEDPAYLPGDC